MPRYFFHIQESDQTVIDQEGSELDSLDAVREEAVESARQIMSQNVLIGRPPNGTTFVITTEEGIIVLEFPFKDAIKS